MKTLDEVIEGFERCHGAYGTDESCEYCPLFDICEHDPQMASPWDDDMYHYLKEYQKKQKTLEIRAAEYKRGFEQLGVEWSRIKDNPPLTWDELKQMEGKPVWVECKFYSHQWAIIGEVTENRIRFYGPQLVDGEPQEEMGTVWQAYRKQRE